MTLLSSKILSSWTHPITPVGPCSSPLPCLDWNPVFTPHPYLNPFIKISPLQALCAPSTPQLFLLLCPCSAGPLTSSHILFPLALVLLLLPALTLFISSLNNYSFRSLPAPPANLCVLLMSSRLTLRVHFSEGFWHGQLDALQRSGDRRCKAFAPLSSFWHRNGV